MHIESRKSVRRGSEYEILVDVECDSKKMQQLTRMLNREVAAINLSQYDEVDTVPHPPMLSAAPSFGELFCKKDKNFYLNTVLKFKLWRTIFSMNKLQERDVSIFLELK